MLSRREAPRHQDYLVVVFMVLFAMNNHHSKSTFCFTTLHERIFIRAAR